MVDYEKWKKKYGNRGKIKLIKTKLTTRKGNWISKGKFPMHHSDSFDWSDRSYDLLLPHQKKKQKVYKKEGAKKKSLYFTLNLPVMLF